MSDILEAQQVQRLKRLLAYASQQCMGDATLVLDLLVRGIATMSMSANDDETKRKALWTIMTYLQQVRNGEFGGMTKEVAPDQREVLLSLTLVEATINASALLHHAEKGLGVVECEAITKKIETACETAASQEQEKGLPNAT